MLTQEKAIHKMNTSEQRVKAGDQQKEIKLGTFVDS